MKYTGSSLLGKDFLQPNTVRRIAAVYVVQFPVALLALALGYCRRVSQPSRLMINSSFSETRVERSKLKDLLIAASHASSSLSTSFIRNCGGSERFSNGDLYSSAVQVVPSHPPVLISISMQLSTICAEEIKKGSDCKLEKFSLSITSGPQEAITVSSLHATEKSTTKE